MFKGTIFRRNRLAKKAQGTPMAGFYDAPWPDAGTPLSDLEFVALDLETTGLSPRKNEIVSIGWTVIRDMKVIYGERGHILVRPNKEVTAESAVIHTLTDDALADAPPLCEALESVLPILAGRVLIAHYIKLEHSFLQRACKTCFKLPFEMPMVDTLALEHKNLLRHQDMVKEGTLRLDAVRSRYNLPRYKAHNAMLDAVAAGELFLALCAHKAGTSGTLVLDDVTI